MVRGLLKFSPRRPTMTFSPTRKIRAPSRAFPGCAIARTRRGWISAELIWPLPDRELISRECREYCRNRIILTPHARGDALIVFISEWTLCAVLGLASASFAAERRHRTAYASALMRDAIESEILMKKWPRAKAKDNFRVSLLNWLMKLNESLLGSLRVQHIKLLDEQIF